MTFIERLAPAAGPAPPAGATSWRSCQQHSRLWKPLLTDRARDLRIDRGGVLHRADLGHHRTRRYHLDRHRQDRPRRAHQGDPAVRNRRGARHPCQGRPARQGWRRPDRARPDHEPGRARAICKAICSPPRSRSRGFRAALTGGDEPIRQIRSARSRQLRADRDRQAVSRVAVAEQRAKIVAIEWQSAQKKAERATTEATIAKVSALIPILQQRVDVRKYLVDKEFGSKLQYLGDMQELARASRNCWCRRAIMTRSTRRSPDWRRRGGEPKPNIAAACSTTSPRPSRRPTGLRQDVIKAEQRTSLLRLTAQEDAVVQQLAVYSIGGVVTPAQTLMVLVPSSSGIEIEAMVSTATSALSGPARKRPSRSTRSTSRATGCARVRC